MDSNPCGRLSVFGGGDIIPGDFCNPHVFQMLFFTMRQKAISMLPKWKYKISNFFIQSIVKIKKKVG